MTESKMILTMVLEDEYEDNLVDKLKELSEKKNVPKQEIFKNKTIDLIEKKRSFKKWKKSFQSKISNSYSIIILFI